MVLAFLSINAFLGLYSYYPLEKKILGFGDFIILAVIIAAVSYVIKVLRN